MTSASQPSNLPEEKLSLSQLLCIQAVQLTERDGLLDDREADFEIATTAIRDKGKLVSPIRELSRRAELILPRHTYLSKRGIEFFLYGIGLPLFALCLFALQLAAQYLPIFLEFAKHQVHFNGFVAFILIQTIFLVPACLMMLPAACWKWIPFFGGKLPMFGISGIIGGMAKIIVQILPASWLKRFAPIVQDTPERQQRSVTLLPEMFDHLVLGKPSVLGAVSAFTSHLFWLILSAWLLCLLFGNLFIAQYNFVWGSSLIGPEIVNEFIQYTSWPLRSFVDIPTGEDIKWLVETETHSGSHTSQASHEGTAEIRARWGWFVLAVQLCYGVIPRFLAFIISWYLMKKAIRQSYTPNIQEEYYQQVLNRILGADLETETDLSRVSQLSAEDQQNGMQELLGAPPVLAPKNSNEATEENQAANVNIENEKNEIANVESAEEQEVVPPPPPPPPKKTVVFGYGLNHPPHSWKELLQLPGEVEDLGSVESKTESDQILAWIRDHQSSIVKLILFLDMANTPTASDKRLLESLDASLPNEAERFAILTSGEEFRKRRDSDVEKIAHRAKIWRDMCIYGRISPNHVFDNFDHQYLTPVSRRAFIKRLAGESDQIGIQLAGKFGKACNLIRASVNKVLHEEDEKKVAEINVNLRAQIDELYHQEKAHFWDLLEKIPLDQQTVDSAASAAEKALEHSGEHVRGGMDQAAKVMTSTWSGISGFVKDLNPRWIVGGAIVGIVAAAPLVPALSIPVVTLPYLLPASGLAGAGVSQWVSNKLANLKQRITGVKETEPIPIDHSEALEHLVTSEVVWALVLELQGNSEEEIAEVMQRVLDVANDVPLNDFDSVDEALKSIEEALNAQ